MIKFGQKIRTEDSDIKYFVTSDLHFWHKGILNFCKYTRPFSDVIEMNQGLIDHWNSVVGVDDEVLHLGDFSFKGKGGTQEILNQLNGNITFVRGNHCKVFRDSLKVKSVDYLEFRFDGVKVCAFHFPISSWNQMSRGSVQLYGHCVDVETEILTPNGWLKYNEVREGEEVISYNFEKGEMEVDSVLKYHLLDNYEGDVYTNDTDKFSFRGTRGHRLVGLDIRDNYKEVLVEDYIKTQTRLKIIRSGVLTTRGCILSNNELKLYICLAADGSLANSDLGRLRVKKIYKLRYFKTLLEDLRITYTENSQKDGSTCLNFTIPKKVLSFNVKGLDEKLMECTQEQVRCILEAYSVTDGYRNKDSTLIYTSKVKEKDLLQRLFTLNGFMCTVGTRMAGHGYSTSDNYELCVTEKMSQVTLSSNFIKENNTGETFWCVSTRNTNFVCRRNGKVHVTGNCHGSFQGEGRCVDVGFDNWGRIIPLQEAIDFCLEREIYCPDHHKIIKE